MTKQSKLLQVSWWIFWAGFFTCTWDLFGTIEFSGKTLKLHQLLFVCSLGISFASSPTTFIVQGLRNSRSAFALSFLALIAYYLLRLPSSFYPQKTFLYLAWLAFSFTAIWVNFQFLAARIQKHSFLPVLKCTVLFLSLITLADHVAYQFGYTNGWIGFNQDSLLKWGVSRPHAFANEPSYLASFLAIALTFLWPNALPLGRKKGTLLLFVLGATTILITTSRTGVLAFLGAFFLLTAMQSWQQKRIAWRQGAAGLGTVLVILAGIFLLTPSQQLKKLDESLVSSVVQGKDGSGNARLRVHKHAATMASETSWLGTGLGASYRYWVTKHQPEEIQNSPSFPADRFGAEWVMSTWGQLLAEGGLAAIFLYAIAAFSLLYSLFRKWRMQPGALELSAFASASIFFIFIAWWIGNLARGDVWVWYAIWCAIATGRLTSDNRASA